MECIPENANPTIQTIGSANPFISFLTTMMAAQHYFRSSIYPPNYGPSLKDGDEFDFIIVGAGSAGSAVAGILSENPSWRVLVLEAGGYPSVMSEVSSPT